MIDPHDAHERELERYEAAVVELVVPPANQRPQKWRQADGSLIAISEMTNRHLLNAAALLKRKGFIGPRTLAVYLFGPGPSGDMAQDAFAAEQGMVFQSPCSPFVDWFEDEIRKRGLALDGDAIPEGGKA